MNELKSHQWGAIQATSEKYNTNPEPTLVHLHWSLSSGEDYHGIGIYDFPELCAVWGHNLFSFHSFSSFRIRKDQTLFGFWWSTSNHGFDEFFPLLEEEEELPISQTLDDTTDPTAPVSPIEAIEQAASTITSDEQTDQEATNTVDESTSQQVPSSTPEPIPENIVNTAEPKEATTQENQEEETEETEEKAAKLHNEFAVIRTVSDEYGEEYSMLGYASIKHNVIQNTYKLYWDFGGIQYEGKGLRTGDTLCVMWRGIFFFYFTIFFGNIKIGAKLLRIA